MRFPRSSGVLFHPTSLPGPYGIGSFNPTAFAFVDFLVSAGQSIWQVLPLGPTSLGDSPYQSFSTYAGNPYLISLEGLLEDGLVTKDELEDAPKMLEDRVNYGSVYEWKLPILKAAAGRVSADDPDFAAFCASNRSWLDDYALFRAIKDRREQQAWNQWPASLRARVPQALEQAKAQLEEGIRVHQALQWLFFRQWVKLKAYANSKGLRIFGDIPIFVAMDSSDAWVHAESFYFDKDLQPTVVAGVPPDYFAVTGQLWGNPLYRWKVMRKNGYRWWIDRVRAAFGLYDMLRIDHFRGFAAYWEVPASESTAMNGRWVKGPGIELFKAIGAALGDLPIVAEDLGDITPDVLALRDRLDYPGMKVVQFGFGGGSENTFLTHNYTDNFVAYPGTHDNDTSRGWFESSSQPNEREHFRRYFGESADAPSLTMIRAAMQSVARISILPLQDLLDLGSAARYNLPGSGVGNWQWRLLPEQLTEKHAIQLRELTELYGRLPSQ